MTKMPSFRVFTWGAAVLLFFIFGYRARAGELVVKSFKETFDSTKEMVSGKHLVGASFFNEDGHISADTLWLYLPYPMKGTLNLQVTKSDARYIAKAEYLLSEPTKGWVKIPYPSDNKELSSYRSDQLAIKVTGNNQKKDERLFLTHWSKVDPASYGMPSFVLVYINSERSDTLYVDRRETKRPMKRCDSVLESRIKFDTVCKIPTKCFKNQSLTLFRYNENSRLGKIPIKIYID